VIYEADLNPLAVQLIIFSVLLGLALHHGNLWTFRQSIAGLNVILIATSTGLIITFLPWFMALLVLIVQAYRIFSTMRIVKNVVDSKELRVKTFRSDTVLSIALVIILAANFVVERSSAWILPAIIFVQLLTAIILFRHVRHMFKSTSLSVPDKPLYDDELPTITVAIPARNETSELTECLQSVLAGNYPKLEVLVLDDCSQDKTSDIIKTFAHRGVRFLQGKQPSDKWVAKTHAYDQLLDDSSGQYVIFCGVDVRFEVDSLRNLVTMMLHKKLNMITVLPLRKTNVDKHFVLQPMRYWRQLVFPKIIDPAPPALSTCWIANRQMLLKHGGFEGLRRSVTPERHIAKGVAANGHYAFIRSSAGLGIASVKNWKAQWDSAVRTRYPELKSRPEAVMIVSMGYFVLLLGPVFTALLGLKQLNIVFVAFALEAYLLLLACHYCVHLMTTSDRSIRPFILFPFSVLLEIIVLNYSMWAYEFSEVIWKGRNVCLPVLKISSQLPSIDR
jgi:glycosyltransferase involved in cell wall biosynthesis